MVEVHEHLRRKPHRKYRQTPSGDYVRERILDPRRFRKLRTVRAGRHRVVVGRLKKDDGRTHTQALLHPRDEFSPGQLRDVPVERIRRRKRFVTGGVD